MASKVEIANMALKSLGADTISDFSEDSEEARKIDAIYEICLRSMLRSHFWNFAMKETALAQLTTTPVLDDYTYVYQLPSDFIRLKKTSVEPDYSHKIKGRTIYSNSETMSIEYVYFLDDPQQYDDSFVDAFAARLAAELCFSITSNASLVPTKWEEYKEKYRKAVSVDSQEETPDEPQSDEWLNARI